jgi:hypothetical protein
MRNSQWSRISFSKLADETGVARPRIIAHRNVLRRFDRYDASHGLNTLVQGQQFNESKDYAYPADHRRPDEVYDDHLTLTIGGTKSERQFLPFTSARPR